MQEKQLACMLASSDFGGDARVVTEALLNDPGISKEELGRRAQITISRVKVALRLLTRHGVVICEDEEPTRYSLILDSLLMRARSGLYDILAKKEYGDLGRVVFEKLFVDGAMTAHSLHIAGLDKEMRELGLDPSVGRHLLSDMARDGFLEWVGTRDVDQYLENPDDHPRKRVGLEDTAEKQISIGTGTSTRIVDEPSRTNNKDIWRLSYWYMNRCYRNMACHKIIGMRCRLPVVQEALIVGLTLALRKEGLSETDDCETADVNLDDVKIALRDGNIVQFTDKEYWRAIKVLLSMYPSCVKAYPIESPATMRFIPGRLISESRQKSLEEFLFRKYKEGRRVFRALMIEGAMDEQMLADRCMMAVSDVQKVLQKMYADKFVGMQQLVTNRDQYRSKAWLYLWLVRPQQVAEAYLQILYKTQINVMLRLEMHRKIQVPSDEEGRKLYDRQLTLLELSYARIDQDVMMMRDFGKFTNQYYKVNYIMEDLPSTRLVTHKVVK